MSDRCHPPVPRPRRARLPADAEQPAGRRRRQPPAGRGAQGHGHGPARPCRDGDDEAQVQAMFSASPDEPFNADAGHRHRPQDGRAPPVTPASATRPRREVEEAAQVAGLWLDEVTQLHRARRWRPGRGAGPSGSRRRCRCGAPGRAGRRGRQRGHRGGHARADGRPRPLAAAAEGSARGHGPGRDDRPDGADAGPDERLDVRRCRSARPSARSRGDTLSGTEVGLPLVQATSAVALLPANIAAFAEGLEVDLGRGAALPRRPRGRPGAPLRRRAVARARSWSPPCGTTPATSASTPTGSSRRCSRSTRPTRPPCSRRCRTAVHARAQRGAAGRAGRLETYLALVEGWVDVVADRATARAPAARRGARRGRTPPPGVRRARREGVRRAGRARAASAPPARRREPLGGPGGQAAASPPATAPGRTPTWRRPRPTSTTRSGYVERVRDAGSAGGDDMDAALDAILREGESGGGPA